MFASPHVVPQVSSGNQAWYASAAAGLFNSMVPESSYKWPNIEPTKGQLTGYVNQAISLATVSAQGGQPAAVVPARGVFQQGGSSCKTTS